MIISLIKSQVLHKQLQIQNPRTFKLCIKVSLAEIFLICKLVDTTRVQHTLL